MKLTKEQLDMIAKRLCRLSMRCQFVYDDSLLGSRIIGIHCNSYDEVVGRLQAVLDLADDLLDEVHCVSAVLDDLLIKDKYLDDVEVSDV